MLGLLKSEISKDGWIRLGTRKTGQEVDWPIHSKLRIVINELMNSHSIFVCLNSRGEAWSKDGFDSSFYKFKKGLLDKGLVGENLTFHGLRHTIASIMRSKGISDENIAIALGHASPEMSRKYGKKDRDQKSMKNIISILDAKI